jgi:hypothetical protein
MLSRVADVIDLQLDDVIYGVEKCILVAPELATSEVTQWRRQSGATDLVLRLERLPDARYQLAFDIVPTGDELSLTPLLRGEVSVGTFDLTLDLARQQDVAFDPFIYGFGEIHLTATTLADAVRERHYDLNAVRDNSVEPWRRITAWDLGADGGAVALEDLHSPDSSRDAGGYARWDAGGGRYDGLEPYATVLVATSNCWDPAGTESFDGIAQSAGGAWSPVIEGNPADCRFAPLADLPSPVPALAQLPPADVWSPR